MASSSGLKQAQGAPRRSSQALLPCLPRQLQAQDSPQRPPQRLLRIHSPIIRSMATF